MLLHQLVLASAQAEPQAIALRQADREVSYADLSRLVEGLANGLAALGVRRRDRVAVFLPKSVETVAAFFGTSMAGGVFVPVNPVLKAPQVAHIVRDSGARVLITSAARAEALVQTLAECPDLQHIVLVDAPAAQSNEVGARAATVAWRQVLDAPPPVNRPRAIDADMAAILFTAGSTGRPKGVVLSHRNMVAGAQSVSQYLANQPADRLLAVLPFSFDYGFSQLSTAFLVGASVALMEYLMPRDILAAVARYRITGLAAVPPLWIQLAELEWPAQLALRYITNSGGAMPQTTLAKLRARLPSTKVFLMYGLTEAFRSTYLPPDQVDIRPTSMGKAIPNAEILVVRPDGTPCAPGEPGELVHRGALVSLGYWKDTAQTAARFRPAPGQSSELPLQELAVWSGDTVTMDEEGYLYFVGRRDEMIKTSGYRVSPTEVEEVVYATGLVTETVAVGAPHPVLGSAIVVIAVSSRALDSPPIDATNALLTECRRTMPSYMVPTHIEWRTSLPRNANGKLDRPALAAAFGKFFSGGPVE
jgi:acyl-CoA ligase (AMP-forming) (exosortase A-associated)